MELERFQDLLDIHGSELAAWPDAERPAAIALLAESEVAAALLVSARRLDWLLSGGEAPAVAGPELRERIVASAKTGPRLAAHRIRLPPAPARRRETLPWRLAGLAAAASLALGVFVSASGVVPEDMLPEFLAADSAEMIDVAALAYGAPWDLEDLP